MCSAYLNIVDIHYFQCQLDVIKQRKQKNTNLVYNLQIPSPKHISPNSTCIHSTKESGFVFYPGDERTYFFNAVFVSVFNTYKVFVIMTGKKIQKSEFCASYSDILMNLTLIVTMSKSTFDHRIIEPIRLEKTPEIKSSLRPNTTLSTRPWNKVSGPDFS